MVFELHGSRRDIACRHDFGAHILRSKEERKIAG